MEKSRRSFLVRVSFIISVVYAMCFFENKTGIACTVFGVFMAILMWWFVKRRDSAKLSVWDFVYGILLILLSIIPAYTDNRFVTKTGKLLFGILLIKWAIHIAYGVKKISFLRNLTIFFEFVFESVAQFFSLLTDRNYKRNNMDDNNMYRQNRGNNPNSMYHQRNMYNPNGMYYQGNINNPRGMNNQGNMNHPNGMNNQGNMNYPNGMNNQGNMNHPNGMNNQGNMNYPNGMYNQDNINSQNEINSEMNLADSIRFEGRKHTYKRQILMGIMIAIPVLIVVLGLLASSDVVFRNLIADLLLGIDDIFDIINWFFIMCLAFLVSYGCGRTLMLRKVNISDIVPDKANSVTGITFSGIFSAVYVLFCIVQLITILSNGSVLPEGYTYAKYARTGFSQLLIVCVINVFMVIICRIKFEESNILKTLLTVISVCTYFMIASSAYRMLLYIDNYMLTFKRIQVLWVLAVIAVLMIFVICFIYNDKISLFEYGLATFVIMFILFAAIRPDNIITSYNTENFVYGESDGHYIFYRLSMDGAETLIHSGIGHEYESNMEEYCELIVEKYERKYKGDIRKFNWSRYIAYKEAKKYLE